MSDLVRSFREVLVVVLAIFLVGSACTDTDESLGVVPVPDIGETTPEFLEDGHPVFVVHDLDGTVLVIEAISTHITEDQMAWCPSSRTIDDVFHGARWDARGRYGSGPGASDLGSYEIDVSDAGSELTVLAYLEPASRSQSPDGIAGPDCVDGGYQIHPFHQTG